MDYGGDVRRHCPSVVSRRGVTGGRAGEARVIAGHDKVGRCRPTLPRVVYVLVEFIRWEVSKVKSLASK